MASHEERTWANIDLRVVVAALVWMPSLDDAVDAAERAQWMGWLRSLMAVVVATIPRRSDEQEKSPIPSHDETTALTILGARLATLSNASERRSFWEPLFSVGVPAVYYVRYFVQPFFRAGFQDVTPAFQAAWNEMVTWVWTAPMWQSAGGGHQHEIRELWWTLLLLENGGTLGLEPTQTALIAAMKPHYEKWAQLDLTDARSGQRLIGFLRQPVAAPILADGIVWLDSKIDYDPKQRWRVSDLLDPLSNFVVWLWTKHEALVRRPEVVSAYQRLLTLLVSEQDEQAMALMARVTGS